MLKRIYIDNYKCFSNFELSLGPINLFLGPNGCGKSAVFDVIRKIQMLVAGEGKARDVFPPSELTRWDRRLVQTFELDIEGNGGVYRYRLEVEHDHDRSQAKIAEEMLTYDNQRLFHGKGGETHLYRDDGSAGPVFPSDWTVSGLPFLMPRKDNTLLTWVRNWFMRFTVVRMLPGIMNAENRREDKRPDMSLANYASWWRHLRQEQSRQINELERDVREALEGFKDFRNGEIGEGVRVLNLVFEPVSSNVELSEYRLDELSDGQRALIGLYTLAHCVLKDDSTLCIDEPENHVALPEIQPWLTIVYDLCCEGRKQCLIISHHPKIINYLAEGVGYWFYRDNGGPVRLASIAREPDSEMPISTLVERGWIAV